jgi:hypothetical protein
LNVKGKEERGREFHENLEIRWFWEMKGGHGWNAEHKRKQ